MSEINSFKEFMDVLSLMCAGGGVTTCYYCVKFELPVWLFLWNATFTLLNLWLGLT